MAVPKQKTYGVFTKVINGQTERRTAYSPSDAVEYVFNGWVEVKPVEKAADKPAESAPKSTTK